MRAWIVAASLLLAVSVVGDETFTVRGAVTADDGPLPGCTVKLRGEVVREKVSNSEGQYRFDGVQGGDYILEFSLDGFARTSRELRVTSDVDVQTQQLSLAEMGPITVACGGPPCSNTPPESAYQMPLCSDYSIDQLLIESATGGDRSAIAYLQRRYETTLSYQQKNRIAVALLGRVPDDRVYWNALVTYANDAIRYAYVNDSPTLEFEMWCSLHKVDVEDHHSMLGDVFRLAADDKRARPLLLRALATSEIWLVMDAVDALSRQKDHSALTEIGKAIARFPDDRESMARFLLYFESEAADTLALSLLDDEGKTEYLRQRDEYRASLNR